VRWVALAVVSSFSVLFLWLRFLAANRARARERLRARLLGARRSRSRLAGLGQAAFTRLERVGLVARLHHSLDASGLGVSWEAFRSGWLLCALILPAAAVLAGRAAYAPVALALTLSAPGVLLGWLVSKRKRRLAEQCDRLAGDVALYLACGMPLATALCLSSRACGPPLGPVLASVGSGAPAAGDPLVTVREVARLSENPDLVLLTRAIAASRQTGSDIKMVMAAAGDALRERSAIRRELESQTVQGRLSGRIVAGLPLVFLALMSLMSSDSLSVLLGTVPGLLMLGSALALDLVGFLWIRRILDIKT
jgi:tight adherence protein B